MATAARMRAAIDRRVCLYVCTYTCQLQSDTVNKETRAKAQIRAGTCTGLYQHKQTQAWFAVEALHIS